MTSPDFSIPQFLAWARTKPADERYDYWDTRNCAMCQFLRDRGLPVRAAGGDGGWEDADEQWHEAPQRIPLAAEPHTYGALVTRLEKLCPSEWVSVEAYLPESVEA